jgi:hypothetical protein
MSIAATPRLDQANAEALDRLVRSEPVLMDVRPAIDAIPGFTHDLILTSGAPMPWERYTGGQRRAIVGGALFEGLAVDDADAERKLAAGEIRVGPCHDYGCVGSLAGIYTASMPVFVVENKAFGNIAYCNSFEGVSRKRLNYGVYDDEVRESLIFLQDVAAPVLAGAVRASGGIPLNPLIRRALNMGDELHSRNAASTLLISRELFPHLLALGGERLQRTRETVDYLINNDYFFLRLSMAASKATADAACGLDGSSVVTAMTFSCAEFSIRASGLGDAWYSAPLPRIDAKLFDGFTEADIEFMGGESIINETVGLGGFAQAAAFPLQDYQGGTPDQMIRNNLQMYRITVGEHPLFRIPALGFRGTPTGIDVGKVLRTGIRPLMDIGIAGRSGGQIGAGVMRAPIACFEQAAQAYEARYGVRVV